MSNVPPLAAGTRRFLERLFPGDAAAFTPETMFVYGTDASRRFAMPAAVVRPESAGQIKELLDTRVRPAVAQDGGDITFHGFDRGVVYLHMQGACAGCPSSTMTLKMGIENLLRHYIPEVTEVRPIA